MPNSLSEQYPVGTWTWFYTTSLRGRWGTREYGQVTGYGRLKDFFTGLPTEHCMTIKCGNFVYSVTPDEIIKENVS